MSRKRRLFKMSNAGAGEPNILSSNTASWHNPFSKEFSKEFTFCRKLKYLGHPVWVEEKE